MNKWALSSQLSHLGAGEWLEENKVRGNYLALHSLPCCDLTFSARIYSGCRKKNFNPSHLTVRGWSLVELVICIPSLRSTQIKVQIFNCLYLFLEEEKLWDVSYEVSAKPDYSSAHTLGVRSMLTLLQSLRTSLIY